MIIKIADNFPLNSLNNIFDISKLLEIEVVHHAYGAELDRQREKLVWMQYAVLGGRIAFTRNLSKFYPEVANYVVSYLETLFDIKFCPEGVHFMRTYGCIPPHVDEDGRKCCINIGISNTNSAITSYSDDLNRETYLANRKECTCQDGSTYLLNTSTLHAVAGSNINRLLLTYGFEEPFATIRERIKQNS